MGEIQGTNDTGQPVVKKQFAEDGTFQIVFKNGATVILDNCSLWGTWPPGVPPVPATWHFERNGVKINYGVHAGPETLSQAPLDNVIDAIIKLK